MLHDMLFTPLLYLHLVWIRHNSIHNLSTLQYISVFLLYCRHPIPDYYSITLEISRDRITTARQVVCDDSDPHKPACPRGLYNRDLYLSRSLNNPCEKMVSKKTVLCVLLRI